MNAVDARDSRTALSSLFSRRGRRSVGTPASRAATAKIGPAAGEMTWNGEGLRLSLSEFVQQGGERLISWRARGE